MQKIDLHTHSTCSDGTNTPSELMALAAKAGIDVLALTDHDTVDGIDEAKQVAKALDIRLIHGVEISCSHTLSGGYGKYQKIDKIIHVVALDFSDVSKMNATLQALQDARHRRGEQMVARLARLLAGGDDGFADMLWQTVLKKVQGNARAVGRAHIAQVLQEKGIVPTVQAAFDKYLADNKPAYVPIETISMAQAVALIHDCGGLAVLAHPTRYKLSATRTQRLIADFADCGGDACELPNHEPKSTLEMIARAIKKHNLLVSVGSDFHGSTMPWRRLGSTATPLPLQTGVWQRFANTNHDND